MTTPNPLVEVRFFNREAVTTAEPVIADVADALGFADTLAKAL